MHKFNYFQNVLNFLGKENRLCFLEKPGEKPEKQVAQREKDKDQKEIPTKEERKKEADKPAESLKKPFSSQESISTDIEKIAKIIGEKPEKLKYWGASEYGFGKYKYEGQTDSEVRAIYEKIAKASKEGKLKGIPLVLLGGTDGTEHNLVKYKAWHEKKAEAFKFLLANTGKIAPALIKQKIQDNAKLIQAYINSSNKIKFTKQNKDEFLKGQGLFDLALAMQRAQDLAKDIGIDLEQENISIFLDLKAQDRTTVFRRSVIYTNGAENLYSEKDAPEEKEEPKAKQKKKTPKVPEKEVEDKEEAAPSPKPEPKPKRKRKPRPKPKPKQEDKEKAPAKTETPEKFYGILSLYKNTITVVRPDMTQETYGLENQTGYQVVEYTSDTPAKFGHKYLSIMDGKTSIGVIYYDPAINHTYYVYDNDGKSKIKITFDNANKKFIIAPAQAQQPQAQPTQAPAQPEVAKKIPQLQDQTKGNYLINYSDGTQQKIKLPEDFQAWVTADGNWLKIKGPDSWASGDGDEGFVGLPFDPQRQEKQGKIFDEYKITKESNAGFTLEMMQKSAKVYEYLKHIQSKYGVEINLRDNEDKYDMNKLLEKMPVIENAIERLHSAYKYFLKQNTILRINGRWGRQQGAIKESGKNAIAIDYTESEEDIWRDIMDGLEKYWVNRNIHDWDENSRIYSINGIRHDRRVWEPYTFEAKINYTDDIKSDISISTEKVGTGMHLVIRIQDKREWITFNNGVFENHYDEKDPNEQFSSIGYALVKKDNNTFEIVKNR